MTINQKIKELRQAKGLSQAKLAKAIGYTQQAIAQWENAQKRPISDAVIALAIFFDVTTDYLLGLENEDGTKIKTK